MSMTERKLKYPITMYLACKKFNNVMRSFDMKPDYKWFIKDKLKVEVEEASIESLSKLIKESEKDEHDVYIPLITCGNVTLLGNNVKEISDGKKIVFVRGSHG